MDNTGNSNNNINGSTVSKKNRKPDILIIVFDAARAENWSVMGYDKPTTPNLERLAEHFVIYQNCISAATWTLPSSTGLFTGMYPSSHRLVIDGDRLSDNYKLMAQIFSQQGYRTAKVTGQVPYVSDFTGLDRGFETHFEPAMSMLRKLYRGRKKHSNNYENTYGYMEGVDLMLDLEAEARLQAKGGWARQFKFWLTGWFDVGAKACFAEARRLWQQTDRGANGDTRGGTRGGARGGARGGDDRPLFLYIHLQETHAEYKPPHRYRKLFVPAELRSHNFATINQRPNTHAAGAVEMSEEDFAILTGLYDGCIRYLDEQVGKFIDDLNPKSQRFNDAFMLVTADHGDCIGRHGVLGHQFVCYDELVHIPWLVKWPRLAGQGAGVVDKETLVQNVDLLPTLCKLLDIDVPTQNEGIDILHDKREVTISELLKPFGGSAVRQGLHNKVKSFNRAVLAVRSLTNKLVTYSNDQADEFFDLVTDPGEKHNLLIKSGWGVESGEIPVLVSEEYKDQFEKLSKVLNCWKPQWQEAAIEIEKRIFEGVGVGDSDVEISPEIEERLKELGYLD